MHFWITTSSAADPSEPQITHFIGKSPDSTFAPRSDWNVRTSDFHLSASAVMPPATSMPVAGHMTHRRTLFLSQSAPMTFLSSRNGGRMTHESSVPISMLVQTRMPMIIPEPRLSSSSENPTPSLAEKELT